MPYDLDKLERFPLEPGVYIMKNARDKVIYVGKAISLKSRVKQYFAPGRDSRPMIPYLLMEIDEIEALVVTNEKEALLLENTLIKKHKPKYNALLKDDKTFISLLVNIEHKWPRIRLIRYKGKAKEKGLYFGPYTSAFAARQTAELLGKLFPLRQCSDEELKRRTRPCLLYGIKRCIAPCVNKCTKDEYDTFVQGAIDFLKGKDDQIIAGLKKEMEKASDNLEFEKAGALLNTIKQIEHVTRSRQLVQKTGGKDSDSLGIHRHGDEAILMQLFVREGRLIGSEHYTFKNALESDEEILTSFILQFYQKKQKLPQEILLPFELKESATLEEILKEEHGKSVHVICPQKGNKKGLVQLAEKNAKSTYEMEKSQAELLEQTLLDLVDKLSLTRFPSRIECFDTSNIAGTDLVASMVAFTGGKKDKGRYRLFKIKNLDKGDDYGAMRQVLTRRLTRAKEEDDLPDLVMVDGGKGQLNLAVQILKDLDIASVDVIALTKEQGRHDKGLRLEKVYVPEKKEPIHLGERSSLLFFLQTIRDEAHDKAIGFHKKRRQKRLISTTLTDIPGIGPVKKKRLLKTLGSVKRIKEASDEELLAIPGISAKDVELIRQHL